VATVVGTLQVDLVANTASFTYDLDQGGKAARKFGADASEGFGSAREGAKLAEEAIGVRLPRGLNTLLARIPILNSAFSSMLPIAGVLVAISVIAELVQKHNEAMEKMREASANFGTASSNVFRSLEDKILEAGIKADELAGDHLGKLSKELRRIDLSTFEQLETQFNVLAKAGEAAFDTMKAHWYTFGEGSRGAQNALNEFKRQYDTLIEAGKDKEATDLLAGTLQSAVRVQKQLEATQSTGLVPGLGNQIKAQQTLVDVLQNQLKVQHDIADEKRLQQGNARTETSNAVGEDADKAFNQQAEQARQAAEAEEKAFEEKYREAVSALQESEKQKIDATRTGSAERIAAIDAAIKEEQAHGLQDTEYYKGLQLAKVNAVKERADMEEKINNELAKADADNTTKMAQLKNAADDQNAKFELAMRRSTAQQALESEIASENRRYEITQEASARDLALLQQGGERNAAEIKKIHDKIEQETQAHENKLTQIRETAEEQRNKRILASETQLEEGIARNMAQTIVTGKNLAQSMEKMGAQMLEGMVSHTLMMIMTQDWQRASDARTAAANAYASVSAIPVVGPFLAPEAAAGAFAAVMAFEGGGIIPGVSGGRDSVNAVLEPEEMVLPRTLSSGLQKMIRDGGANNRGGDTHIHVQSHVHNPQALDADGMHDILEAHADTIARHVSNHFRKQNK
jgi:hypothetical protein